MKHLPFLTALLLLIPSSQAAAFEVEEGVGQGPDGEWLTSHVETVRRAHEVQPLSVHLSNANVWSRGLDRQDPSSPVAGPMDKAMGARVRLLKDYDLQVGTALSRHEDTGRALRSEFNWQFSWSHALRDLGGVSFGLGAGGAVESLHGGLSQSVRGSLGLPLITHENWKARLRVSPQVSYDSQSHQWRSNLVPEFVSERILSSTSAPFLSLLNLRVGYDLAPQSRPSATARLELRFVARP